MALGPKDLELTDNEIKECDAFCKKMDAVLKKRFRPGEVNQEFIIIFGPREDEVPELSDPWRLSGEITKRYKDAGWRENGWSHSGWIFRS